MARSCRTTRGKVVRIDLGTRYASPWSIPPLARLCFAAFGLPDAATLQSGQTARLQSRWLLAVLDDVTIPFVVRA